MVKLFDLLPDKVKDMGTGAAARPPDRDDLFDLIEMEAEAPSLFQLGFHDLAHGTDTRRVSDNRAARAARM